MPSRISSRAIGSGTITAPKLASNAFTVTANSASTANANTINFVNSGTVTITVTNSQTGIANVSFAASEAGLNPFLLSGM